MFRRQPVVWNDRADLGMARHLARKPAMRFRRAHGEAAAMAPEHDMIAAAAFRQYAEAGDAVEHDGGFGCDLRRRVVRGERIIGAAQGGEVGRVYAAQPRRDGVARLRQLADQARDRTQEIPPRTPRETQAQQARKGHAGGCC